MRYSTENLKSFIQEIERRGPAGLFEGTVWHQIDYTKHNELKRDVVFRATAVAVSATGEYVLLEFTTECGQDIDGDQSGTKTATDLVELIERACVDIELTAKEGRFELM